MREGDAIDIQLAGRDQLQCRILGFDGADIVLLVDEGLTPSAAQALSLGTRAFATFERDGQLHAQQGVVRATEQRGQVALRITDTFRVGHRRAHTRAPLELDVDRQPLDAAGAPAGGAVRERTLDVSAGGVSLAPARPAAEGDRAAVVLRLPEGGGIGPVLATVVRVQPESLGLRFEGLEAEDRARLALLVLAWHRDRLSALEGDGV
jgi:c-di-GMP-binding flagellar brake protein YcgR